MTEHRDGGGGPRTFVRDGHGNGAGRPHIENPRKDLPTGVAAAPAETTPAEKRPVARKPDGTPADRAAAAELGRRGGLAAARKRATVDALGAEVPRSLRVGGHPALQVRELAAPFAEEAAKAYEAKRAELARDVGGGVCGVGASACIRTWAHAHHASLMLFELAQGLLMFDGKGARPKVQTDLFAAATRLSAEARQALLSAHSLAAEEAKSRRERDRQRSRHVDPLAAYLTLPERSTEGDDR
jgi:hypothetical protein